MALQTKVYTQTSNTFTLELTLVENSTSTSGNTSSVSYTLKLKSTTKDFYQYGVGATVVLDGKTVAVRDRYRDSQISIGTYSSVTLLSGTTSISHNSDGSKSISVGYTLDMASASYTPGPMSGSGTMTLTTIPRGATITSAPNFTDEDSPTVKYSNPAGGSLQVGIYKTDGFTALAGYRTATGSSYTFHFTATEKANLQKVNTGGNTATVRFYIMSVVGGQTFRHNVERTLTIKNPAPTLSPTVKDTNSTTVALTGGGKIVRYESNAKCTFDDSAVKFATIKSRKVTCAGKSLTANGTISGAASGDFDFSTTDSRGNTTSKRVSLPLVQYVIPTCYIGNNVPNAVGEYELECTGSVFVGSFGKVSNTVTCQYRYRVKGSSSWGSWTSMTERTSGQTYTATANLSGLDYKKTYEFQCRVIDRLNTVESDIRVVVSRPLAEWGKDYWKFNVPVGLVEYDDAGNANTRTLNTCSMTAYRKGNMDGMGNALIPLNAVQGQCGPGIKLQSDGIYIPRSGVYLVSGQMMVGDGAKGYYVGVQINRNGSPILDAYVGYSIGYGVVSISPSVVSLDEGDILTLWSMGANAPGGVIVAGSTRTKLTVVQLY